MLRAIIGVKGSSSATEINLVRATEPPCVEECVEGIPGESRMGIAIAGTGELHEAFAER
jgi:hypothetical protein